MLRPTLKVAFVFGLTLSLGALGEGQKLKKLLPARRVASLGKPETQYQEVTRSEKPSEKSKSVQFRLGLTAGLGASSGSEAEGADFGGSDKGINFGFNADLTAARYFGVELEGASGLKATQSSSVEAETAFTLKRDRSFQGAMGNFKAQVPFRLGHSRLTPRLGAGYGVLSVKDGMSYVGFEDASSSETVATLNVPYVLGGLEFQLDSRWLFSMDFAKSIGGSGHVNFTNSESESVLREVGATRFRASVAYRLSPLWSLGGQYARRSLSFSQPLGDGSSLPTIVIQNQFLALVQLDF